jgi:sulfatase maturation enzyme AslB (radical SAM superfamily)
MKFLLDILGMTNYCNLRCNYCDWEKCAIPSLTQEDILMARRHLTSVREFSNKHFPEIVLVEYTGGEPFLFPELLTEVFSTFEDKWIRIITNGILLNKQHLDTLARHRKSILGISLDGNTMESNRSRFHNKHALFSKVLHNIDQIVEQQIPLMLLCTIHAQNIDAFPDYVAWIESRYAGAISAGRLVMPAHVIISYTKDNGTPSPAQVNRLADFIDTEIERHPLMNNIEGHYRSLSHLLRHNTRVTPCRVFQWAVSMHFRKNNIISDGQFMGFGCGMRGKLDLGMFNVQSEECLTDFRRHLADPAINGAFLKVNESLHDCQRHCFVDWVGIDMILSKQIDLNTAGDWFVFFKDPTVCRFIENYDVPIA